MRRLFIVSLASIFVFAFVNDATAQEIRRFDDAGKGGTSAYIPGMPVPQTTNESTASTSAGGAEPQSFITVFNSAAKKKRGTIDLSPEKMYRGIIPGTRDLMPHVEAAKKRTTRNTLTWVGFQPNRDGSARIFLQTANTVEYSQTSEANRIILRLSATKIPLRNFSRFIDTSFFKTKVKRIESKQKGDDVIVTISLFENASPSIEKDNNYLYLSF